MQKNKQITPLTPSRAELEVQLRSTLPARAQNAHKGSFGRAHLFCGSDTYTGAALLSAEGALRMGVGLTYLYTPQKTATAARARLPELIIEETPPIAEAPAAALPSLAAATGAILIGPGIGRGIDPNASPDTDRRRAEVGNGADDGVPLSPPAAPSAFAAMLSDLLSESGACVVLDADALNLLSDGVEDTAAFLAKSKREVVLTPHPLEFARLSRLPLATLQADRVGCAHAFAEKSGATVVLKGAGTVIASRDRAPTVNPSGSSALAKGGTGDVLAGMLTALLALGMPPYDAALAAAYLHGAAGDTLAATLSDYGVLPSELPAAAARELRRILGA